MSRCPSGRTKWNILFWFVQLGASIVAVTVALWLRSGVRALEELR